MTKEELEDEIGYITSMIGEAEDRELVEKECSEQLEQLLQALEVLNG